MRKFVVGMFQEGNNEIIMDILQARDRFDALNTCCQRNRFDSCLEIEDGEIEDYDEAVEALGEHGVFVGLVEIS